MALDLVEPDKKFVLYNAGKIQVYQPKIDQVTEYDAGKRRAMSKASRPRLFGGSGHDLYKSYDVKYLGTEKVNNIATNQLELTPKSASVVATSRKSFSGSTRAALPCSRSSSNPAETIVS